MHKSKECTYTNGHYINSEPALQCTANHSSCYQSSSCNAASTHCMEAGCQKGRLTSLADVEHASSLQNSVDYGQQLFTQVQAFLVSEDIQ